MQAAAGADESGVITLTAANFRENVEDGNTWLVDFYAPWYDGIILLSRRFFPLLRLINIPSALLIQPPKVWALRKARSRP